MSDQAKPRLLVIDDEPLVGRMLSRLLRKSHEVVAVTGTAEALELAARSRFDAILCDLMLPGSSGPAFLAQLEIVAPEAASVVGFMSGGAFDPEVNEFLETRGDEGWLSKPFERATVLEFLARLQARTA